MTDQTLQRRLSALADATLSTDSPPTRAELSRELVLASVQAQKITTLLLWSATILRSGIVTMPPQMTDTVDMLCEAIADATGATITRGTPDAD